MQQRLHDWHAMPCCTVPCLSGVHRGRPRQHLRSVFCCTVSGEEPRAACWQPPVMHLLFAPDLLHLIQSLDMPKHSMYCQGASQAKYCVPSLQHTDDTKSKLLECIHGQGSGKTRRGVKYKEAQC